MKNEMNEIKERCERSIILAADSVAKLRQQDVARVIDEVCEVLDALSHPVVPNDRVEPAGLLDRLDHERAPLLFLVSLGCGIAMPCCSQ